MNKRMDAPVIANWIIFTHPAWLAAIPAAALPILLGWLGRRKGRRIPVSAVLVQSLALALLAAALSRPQAAMGRWTDLPYLLMTDASGSVRGQDLTELQSFLPAGAKVEKFAFADGITRTAQVENLRHHATRITPTLRMIASKGPNALAAAIIVTDGRFSDADSPTGQAGYSGAARAVADLGVEVFIVPLDAPTADARIIALSARRASASQAEITATVSANAPLKRTLTITRRGHPDPLAVRQLSLTDNSSITIRITDPVGADAAAEYSAGLTGDTVITENDSASALVLPVRQVVAAVGIERSSRPILREIEHPITFISHDAMPADPAAMGRFSSIIVADPTGSAIAAGQQDALSQYVRTGGGLVLVGTGPHKTPADRNGPLNRILPLVANPFQRRPLHLVVLLDKSGSMAQPTARTAGGSSQIKFDLAAEAVAALKDHLTARDTLTVIAFSDRPEVVYDSGGKPGDFAALREAIRRVRPAGSTRVTPAVEAALSKAPPEGRRTMLLIVSDLNTEQFAPAEWADALGRAEAGLAVVAIRADSSAGDTDTAEPPLKVLAGLLNAPYVERDRLTGLAEVFAKLVRRSRGGVLRKGRTGVSVPSALFDTDLTALPEIDAYILSAAQKQAEVLAFTTGGPDGPGDPILGIARAGLGRTVCLAVPVRDTDNTAWADAPAAAKLIAAAVRWSLRSTNDPRFDVVIKRDVARVEITLTVREKGLPLNGLDLSVKLASGRGEQTQTADFEQVAPGRYRAWADWPADLPVVVAVRDNNDAIVWRSSAGVLYPNEYRSLGADWESLRRLGSLTGGRIVRAGQLPDVLKRSYSRRMTDLWPWLIAAALAMMLGEWRLVRISRQ
ncbi:MAG: VWA domain-containing protein [Planctomycetota bacterium]|nr:VWA domain-containing protein [Planctomycetota bacterium]